MYPETISKQYLRHYRNRVIFVFGDNLLRIGTGGAASLRNEPNTYGFITKKEPNNKDSSFYKPVEYCFVFYDELVKLIDLIKINNSKLFLISAIGSGLANKYHIFEKIINPGLYNHLQDFNNVQFLFEKNKGSI